MRINHLIEKQNRLKDNYQKIEDITPLVISGYLSNIQERIGSGKFKIGKPMQVGQFIVEKRFFGNDDPRTDIRARIFLMPEGALSYCKLPYCQSETGDEFDIVKDPKYYVFNPKETVTKVEEIAYITTFGDSTNFEIAKNLDRILNEV